MKVKCDYCGAMVDEDRTSCPQCGGKINGANRMASGEPRTIEDLQQWYQAHQLPPEEVTRFFIGKDVREAKAFGIYRDDNGDFVVYKNKADGTRAVRYQGSDEAYAVNELYQRLRSEIADQKYRAKPQESGSEFNFRPLYKDDEYPDYSELDEEEKRYQHRNSGSNGSGGNSSGWAKFCLLALFWLISFALAMGTKYGGSSGNYNSGGGNSGYYYEYDDDDDDSGLRWNTHNDSSTNNNNDSNWWDSGSSDDSWDWDSDSSWDSGDSWDSGSTDWGSDW